MSSCSYSLAVTLLGRIGQVYHFRSVKPPYWKKPLPWMKSRRKTLIHDIRRSTQNKCYSENVCRHILFGFKSYYVLKRVFSQRLKNIWQQLKWCISETTTNKWWCFKSNWRQIRIHRGWLIDFRVIYVWKYNVGLIVLIDAGTKSAALGVKCNSGFWFLVGYYIFLRTFMFKEKVLKIKKKEKINIVIEVGKKYLPPNRFHL